METNESRGLGGEGEKKEKLRKRNRVKEAGKEKEKRRRRGRKGRKEGFACAHGNEKELLKSGACLATASRFSPVTRFVSSRENA